MTVDRQPKRGLLPGVAARKPAVVCCLAALALSAVAQAASAQQELAKESQNPVGNLISLPLENNISFDEGPADSLVYSLNLKPVYPVNLGDWNLINRGIFPIIYQEGGTFPSIYEDDAVISEDDKFGIGDFTYQAFLSPAAPGPVIWGAGPAFVFPTHSDDRLGTNKWSAGPAVVALTKPGPWLVGGLFQHFWSFAGDSDEDDVNLSSFQYFINYNFDNGWYLSSTPTITANWSAESDDRWTVPFGAGVGRLVKFGEQPVDFKGQVFWNAVKRDDASEIALQFQIKFLFPK